MLLHICYPLNTFSSNLQKACFFIDKKKKEIELSEDYTCVISRGANPKTTHIFGDCILGCHPEDVSNSFENEKKGVGSPQLATNNFLSFCNYCYKELEEGKHIYIYRGEKAFCSLSCRSVEILNDEELEVCDDEPSKEPLRRTMFDETCYKRQTPPDCLLT